MMKTKYLITFVCSMLISTVTFAQDKTEELVGSDKINVVIAVLGVIFVGIIAYLVIIDRKISRIEKQKNKQKS